MFIFIKNNNGILLVCLYKGLDMVINITDGYLLGRRYMNIDTYKIVSVIEAYLYFNNEYMEHMIEDKFGLELPMVSVYLLDFVRFIDYVEEHLMLSHTELFNAFDYLFVALDKLDRYTHYDVEIREIRGNVIVTCKDKGNVLELRYLELLLKYDRKGLS